MTDKARPMLEVRLFGGFEVLLDGQPIPSSAYGRRQTQALLKILLTSRGRVFSKDELIEALYCGENPQKKVRNLRGRISELRRALEPNLDKGVNSQYILRMGEGYCFSSDAPCSLDTEVFHEQVRNGQQAQEKGHWRLAVESYERALKLYRGEFLEADRYAEWSLAARERWQEEYLGTLSQLAQCHAELGDNKKAIDCCKQALAIQPARESVIRQLMQYYYVAGEDSRAVEAYEKGKNVLKERLDVDPSSETQALYGQIRQSQLPRKTSVLDPLRIAVLPFVNLCPNPEDEYFVEGMVEELIYSLSKVRELKVIAQTSALTYKGTNKSIAQIGRELKVGTVVEGSVRKADSKLRITAQLISVEGEEHIWAGEYDRDLDDVFAIQTEISREVTNNLRRHLPPTVKGTSQLRYAGSPKAYELYLEGRYFLKKRFEDSLHKARDSFEKAIEIDEDFALARAGLAVALFLLRTHEFALREQRVARAEKEAKKALSIDGTVGEAYAALGGIQCMFHLDPLGALMLFDRAVELDPQNVEIRHMRAQNLIMLGKFDAGIDCYRRALEIDPFSALANRNLGYALYLAHRYDEALSQLLKAERLERHDWSLHQCIGDVYLQMHQYEKAREAFVQGVEFTRRAIEYLGYPDLLNAHVIELMGEKGVLQQMVEMMKAENVNPTLVALGYFLLGDANAGFEWLERAREERDEWYLYILQDPLMDPVKSDPRYPEHLIRLGVSPE